MLNTAAAAINDAVTNRGCRMMPTCACAQEMHEIHMHSFLSLHLYLCSLFAIGTQVTGAYPREKSTPPICHTFHPGTHFFSSCCCSCSLLWRPLTTRRVGSMEDQAIHRHDANPVFVTFNLDCFTTAAQSSVANCNALIYKRVGAVMFVSVVNMLSSCPSTVGPYTCN